MPLVWSSMGVLTLGEGNSCCRILWGPVITLIHSFEWDLIEDAKNDSSSMWKAIKRTLPSNHMDTNAIFANGKIHTAFLDRIKWEIEAPLPPIQWCTRATTKTRHFSHHWNGGRGGLNFSSILSKIVALLVLPSILISISFREWFCDTTNIMKAGHGEGFVFNPTEKHAHQFFRWGNRLRGRFFNFLTRQRLRQVDSRWQEGR